MTTTQKEPHPPWTTAMQKRKAKILAPFGKRLSGDNVRRFKGTVETMTYLSACSEQSGSNC